ncbi:exported protein of unknown function [Candidatus Filomicrobium marinum]|uniref:Uncharacterized protein n=2 Tax=Filomicrobium TaxID=119044 RepID=A0A0D6JIU7_9HYPH|nr:MULTISPECIES: hypothetical protein [Filomicrobium]MCV0370966.1 hypothetical protein [Filomicrobium sp.]CFX34229.1 exported protein of unknown function [Candidatus Filomicrobium marinum]CPR21871.1 exported protein of unknown function [Candidatus Filomicrobium marinum]SDP50220.1 hypothetical protein SAMN04488061_3204 [Filomicrobium insigne]
MRVVSAVVAAAVFMALMPTSAVMGAEGEARSMKSWPSPTRSAGKDEKVCKYKFPNGEKTVWVCDKSVPCCAWDEIQYVKCGTTFTGCL